MPLPKISKKAPKAKKKAAMKSAMHELSHGPVTAPSRKATGGEARKKQNIAIALKSSGQSKDRPAKGKRKRPRNKGRS
jgi:hypothetical protein